MAVTKVWLEESECISCEACEASCPEVFEMVDGTCTVKPGVDLAELTDKIKDAMASCPVECIKVEEA